MLRLHGFVRLPGRGPSATDRFSKENSCKLTHNALRFGGGFGKENIQVEIPAIPPAFLPESFRSSSWSECVTRFPMNTDCAQSPDAADKLPAVRRCASDDARAMRREDLFCGVVAASIALAVYFATLAPNVTFLDSGELIVAAQHFGVPHPPGYPVWTFLTWLFQLLPLGNAAWECNLLSAICAALAIGTLAALVNASSRFCFPDTPPALRRVVAVSSMTAAAWSISVWSQAVITEVYSLHLLLVALLLVALFRWCVSPASLRGLAPILFLFAFGFATHQLILVLAPLIPLAILLLRRDHFVQAMVWLMLLASYFYGGYAWFSGQTLNLQIAERFMVLSLVAAIVFVLVRILVQRKEIQWFFPIRMAVLIALGLVAYLYLPVASMTNPPMNWGHARDSDGFFYVVNRTQYHGPLTYQIHRTLGPVLGLGSPDAAEVERQATAGQTGRFSMETYSTFVNFLGGKLAQNFSLLGLIFIAASVISLWKLTGRPRKWIVLVGSTFLLVGFFQPAIDGAKPDWQGWMQQMPYHGLTFCLAAVLMAYGALTLVQYTSLGGRTAAIFLALLCLVPPGFAWVANHQTASQRGNWLAWEFGREMLEPLPENAVVFASSDHAYFISTYMIFGESPQAGPLKRDAGFDRRDLFLVTPNQLSGAFYHRTLRDQYGSKRPEPAGPAGRFFSRESLYPAKTLELPSAEDVNAIIQSQLSGKQNQEASIAVCNDMAHVIWRRNKDKYPFYLEEGLPMPWTYSHALPAGLLLELRPEVQDGIPEQVVAADTAFWEKWIKRLEADPILRSDDNARTMLANCRVSIGNLYRYHKMSADARRAYREALAFWPAHAGALGSFLATLDLNKDRDTAKAAIREAVKMDSRNRALLDALELLDAAGGTGASK